MHLATDLAKHRTPKSPEELIRRYCIGIRQGNEAYGVWRLSIGRGKNTTIRVIKIQSNQSTNDGKIAIDWALAGHGTQMRAEWDNQRYPDNGRLVQVLTQYSTPDAGIHAVYPKRHQLAPRVRVFVDFVAQPFNQRAKKGKL